MKLDLHKLMEIGTNGASTMVGCNVGVVTCFQAYVPRVLCIHCIAHHQALVMKDAFLALPRAYIFSFVDKVANILDKWLGNSTIQHA